ncbi:fructose-specific PTS transporter subunit EIIC [Rodentibacter caecimuris]|uniref:protein-N(pi)-phosphohistidine--D-fructose phosphotransferase n=1 Tax=Rodentibacter caecimuris TaxID=1796644 RepID=A0ABX3KVU0_9PAST|nr:PTS fructose transporter subunit EIIBC [Rodentibacter heylii]
MNIFLTQSSQLGRAKAFLLHQVFKTAAKSTNVSIVNSAQEADLAVIFGDTLPNNSELIGKKVFLINEERAINAPETTLSQALIQSVDYVQPTQSATNSTNISTIKNIVAVTACPTGVAHTFLSAEAIETYAKKQGWNIKVETRGQVGVGNSISPEEVNAADLVFVAADIDVPLDKFKGKPMYRTSTGLALKKTAQEFEKAFTEAKIYEGGRTVTDKKSQEEAGQSEKKGLYKHLMTGVSHMLPLVVAGGLLIAISFMFGIKAFEHEDIAYGLPKAFMDIGGGAAFKLMIAVFAGYVAFSIADRPGLAVGLIGGMLASTAGAGILGGIIAGLLAGYSVKWLNALIKLPASLSSLKPILILPLLGSAVAGLMMVYVINPPVATIMETLSTWLKSMNGTNAILFGLIIGGMMCIDMGGPVNKAAYAFSVGMIASDVTTPMAAAMAGGMVPPIGMAIATWLARNKFTINQRNGGNTAFILGLCFISEGALPFVAADPVRVILCSVIGGATAGAISSAMAITLNAPHGGLFVIPFVSQPLMYLAAISIGALITGILYSFIKPKVAVE